MVNSNAIMVNSNVTTITLNGNEIKIEFGSDHSYYQITNKGDTDIYVSMSPNITPETDGVYTVSAGGSEIIGDGYPFDAFYLLGTGKAYIRGKRDAMSASFKPAAKGGDSGDGDGLKTKIVTELPEIGDSKYLYLVPKDDLLSDNIYDEYIWIDGKWELIGDTAIEVNLENYVQNPDNLNIMVVKNGTNGLSSSTFTFNDHIQINTNFPLLNKLPNGENRQIVEMSIPSASQSRAGVMTAADKTKMDNLPLDLSDYATIEQLNGKQNILTKTELSDGSVDWNTLIGTAIYPITIPQGLTDDFTHGLEGIGGYGTLIVLGDNRHTGCYQIYINDEYKIYLRSYYSDSRGWRNCKRIDAGAGVTLKPGISDPTIDWNTITESGLYTIGHDGKITADSHGPLGVTGWGLLTVINTGLGSANPACIRQVYEAGSGSCYTRNKWQINGEWSPWYKYQCQEYTPAQNEEV